MSITTSTSFGLTHRVSAYPLGTGVSSHTITNGDPPGPVTPTGEPATLDGEPLLMDGEPVYMGA